MARWRLTARFEKSLRGLDRRAQDDALKAIQKFAHNPRLPGLNLEKLSGKGNLWTIRVNRGFRILLRPATDDAGEVWTLEDIGPHDSYRQW